MKGRYRLRTWLRGKLPWSLAGRIPKGEDCGNHEWYFSEPGEWACYHCRVTTEQSPWDEGSEWAMRRLTAIFTDLNIILNTSAIPSHEIAAELEAYQPEIERLSRVIADDPSKDYPRLIFVPSSTAVAPSSPIPA